MTRTGASFACCGARYAPGLHKCIPRPAHGTTHGSALTLKPQRPGQAAEDALADALAGPFVVMPFAAWIKAPDIDAFVRQFPVGMLLNPTRRYVADFYCHRRSLAVEADGGAHAAGKRKMERDRERRGLLTAAGIRVLPVDPKNIPGALDLIRSALEVKNA